MAKREVIISTSRGTKIVMKDDPGSAASKEYSQPKFAIISSSEVMASGRMDAGFHIINQEYADRAAAISLEMSAEEVLDLLSNEDLMPLNALSVIKPLVRGGSSFMTRDRLLMAAKEYPFHALAIIRDKGAQILKDHRNELLKSIQSNEQAQARLSETPDVPTGIDHIPSMLRATIKTHNFVAGVVYSDGKTLSVPVRTDKAACVADCWEIPVEDWRGPDTIKVLVDDGNVPVPCRPGDLGKPIGFIELPNHSVNYGMGWRQTGGPKP